MAIGFKDITGIRFTRLIVLGYAGRDKQNVILWNCLCNCGVHSVVRGSSLKSGVTKSCGCLSKERTGEVHTIHGESSRNYKSKLYKSWHCMFGRCRRKSGYIYSCYTKRGISVCKRWRSFLAFKEDMGDPPTKNHTLERINNARGYCRSNCCWATRKEQARNRRSNIILKFNGVAMCMAAWAEKLGISKVTLWWRLNAGWPLSKALTKGKQYARGRRRAL